MPITIANDFSVVEDACTGLVDAALPPDVRQVCDVPSKVQYLFLGLGPPVGTEPLEVGLKIGWRENVLVPIWAPSRWCECQKPDRERGLVGI